MSYCVLRGRKEWNADGADETDMYELNHKKKGYLTANERELTRIRLENRDRRNEVRQRGRGGKKKGEGEE